MAPKGSDKGGKGGKGEAPVPQLSILEATFPAWSDEIPTGKDAPKPDTSTEKYEDIAGTVLPPETQPYLDAWKRPEELVQNMPNLPIVLTVPVAPPPEATDKKAAKNAPPPPPSRDLEGALWAGHKTFEWLQAVFVAVMSAKKLLKPGDFLWELIHPKDPKDGSHMKPPNGKYKVRLYIMDTWRTVVIDDRIPVDLFGRPLLVGSRPLQLWPLLLSKAVLKVMAAMRVTHLELPHQVSAFQLLTGWPQENLLDPPSGVNLAGGFLFDRLEDSVRGNEGRVERSAIATVVLRQRALPEKPPPRIVVITGPSAVGRAALMQRLVAEYPDKFGLTVSHTSRRPREHEVHGRDYFFTDKAALRAGAASGRFLEVAPVHHSKPRGRGRASCLPAEPEAYLYGVSIDTVREVAATGKLCVMGIDEQGVAALQANKRIDGLYVYLAPPSLEVLETRLRGRLKEQTGTITKRLAWAKEQMAQASKPGLFDHVVDNTEVAPVYHSLKEAISTLSPIIRNRLRGLPAYVLDYSDLIPPNLVEKPFLKPVIISGPTTGERKRLVEQLVREFPDVFAIPRATTTRPPNEKYLYALTHQELSEHEAEQQAKREAEAAKAEAALPAPLSRSASPALIRGASVTLPGGGSSRASTPAGGGTSSPLGPVTEEEGAAAEAAAGEGAAEEEEEPPIEYPEPVTLSEAEFEEAVASGRLLEHHSDLFVHEMAKHRHGTSAEAIKEVIMSGKLPLLELEAEGAAAIKARGIDCLTIFLRPPSEQVFADRVTSWLTESDEEISARMERAKAQMEAASSSKLFDVTLINDDVETTYSELTGLIARLRPDILGKEVDEQEREKAAELQNQPLLVVCGPSRGGREALVAQLVATYPDTFSVPAYVTDRKPAKGEASTPGLTFLAPKEFTKVMAEGQVVFQRPHDPTGKEAGTLAVTAEALAAVTGSKKVAVLEVPDPSLLPQLKATSPTSGALYVYVSSPAAAAEAPSPPGMPPAPTPQVLLAAGEEARASGQYHLVVSSGSTTDIMSSVREELSAHVPEVVPAPFRPLVIAGPFGTGKRVLLQRLFESLPGRFAAPIVTTTKETSHPDVDDRPEMQVVSQDEARQLAASGAFLYSRTAMGHTYGVQRQAVKKVQATGRVCVVELDHVEDAKKLRDSGFEATYLYIGLSSMDELLRRIHAEVASNPPLGYEPDEAAALFFKAAKQEVATSKEEGLFDEWVDLDSSAAASFGRLAEAVHRHYPTVVVAHFVYGYGRGLWDPSVRQHGAHPLRVMVLGPAAAGKSTACDLLATQFQLPHINVGDLLYEEIAKKTPLGLEAKEFMDATKTVPDRFFLELLSQRLAQPDCCSSGWLLDGFPHTAEQARCLSELGIIPDKVVFLTGEHSVLLDRTRYRRVDMETGRVYHMAESGALSPALPPLTKEGAPDTEVIARLHMRHDDSEENVVARLHLWDQHYQALRAVYEDVSLRVPSADGSPPQVACDKIAAFLSLEANVKDIEVVQSSTLKELQYEVVDTLRYRRRQLLRLWQADGNKAYWVEVAELAGNAHCLLLQRSQSSFAVTHQLRRLDLGAVSRTALLWVNSPEPCQVLINLALGPQSLLEDKPQVPRKVLVVSGPEAAGKTTLISHLLSDHPDKLALVRAVTTRDMRKGDTPHYPFHFVAPEKLGDLQSKGKLLLGVVAEYNGAQYAVLEEEVQEAWAAGCIPVLEAPMAVAAALRAAAPPPAPPVVAPPPAPSPTPGKEGGKDKDKSSGGSLARSGHSQDMGASLAAAAAAAQAPPPEPSLSVVSLYLTADLGTLDVRMREVGCLEEQQLQQELVVAEREMADVSAEHAAFEKRKAAALAEAARTLSSTPTPPPVTGGGSKAAAAAAEAAAAAAAQAAAAAAAMVTAACTPPPHVPDHIFANTERTPLGLHIQLKAMVAGMWHRPRVPVPCQVLLEDFNWSDPAPGATRKRLRTVMAGGTTLELGRGQHLMRVTAAAEYLHALTFYSVPPCKADDFFCVAGELSRVLGEMSHVMGDEDPVKASVQNLDGQYDPLPAGGTALLLRYNLKTTQPTTMSATLAVSGEDMRALTRLVLIDNSSGQETVVPAGRLPPLELQPHEAGYTIIALAAAGTPSSQSGRLPGAGSTSAPSGGGEESGATAAAGGTWFLQIISSSPLAPAQETSVARVQAVEGHYKPNVRRVLARQMLTPIHPLQTALVASTEPPLPFTLAVQQAPTGQEVVWGAEYPALATREASEGSVVVGNLSLTPGKYMVELVLAPASECPEGWQPDPVTGSIEGAGGVERPLKWKLVVAPTVDDKVCPLTADESQAKYFRSMQDAWGGGGGGAGAAAAGKAPAKPPAAGKGGAVGGGGGGARAAAASALLDKVLVSMGLHNSKSSAAAAGMPGAGKAPGTVSPQQAPPSPSISPSAPPVRTMKDGTTVALDADAHLRHVLPEVPVPPAQVTAEQLAQREADAEAAAAQAAGQVAAQISSRLTDAKGHRQELSVRKVSELQQWRKDAQSGQKSLLAARADAIKAHKVALAEAAAAAAAEAAAGAPPVAAPVAVK